MKLELPRPFFSHLLLNLLTLVALSCATFLPLGQQQPWNDEWLKNARSIHPGITDAKQIAELISASPVVKTDPKTNHKVWIYAGKTGTTRLAIEFELNSTRVGQLTWYPDSSAPIPTLGEVLDLLKIESAESTSNQRAGHDWVEHWTETKSQDGVEIVSDDQSGKDGAVHRINWSVAKKFAALPTRVPALKNRRL